MIREATSLAAVAIALMSSACPRRADAPVAPAAADERGPFIVVDVGAGDAARLRTRPAGISFADIENEPGLVAAKNGIFKTVDDRWHILESARPAC